MGNSISLNVLCRNRKHLIKVKIDTHSDKEERGSLIIVDDKDSKAEIRNARLS